MSEQAVKSLQTLASVLSIAKKVVDEEWAKLTPEQKAKIRDNILKRAMKRVEAKQNGGAPC